jgi:hypothetical protein
LKATFPFKRDFYGILRERFPIFTQGVFQGFTWYQDDADEFGAQPTGHTVTHPSLAIAGGELPVDSLQALVALPRDRDLLYIPFLHYMNIVNPSKAVITASSRFGALLLKADGSAAVPYNVRLTQSLLELFAGKRWAFFTHPTNEVKIRSPSLPYESRMWTSRWAEYVVLWTTKPATSTTPAAASCSRMPG